MVDTPDDILRNVQVVERLLALRKARDRFLDFVRFTMPDPEDLNDHTRSRYQAVKHHEVIGAALEEVEAGRMPRLIITMPPRHGKALALDTPIPTPSGWTTMGELRVGDEVFSEFGIPIRVKAVSQVWRDRPVYRVRTDDGDEIVADENHEWLVSMEGRRGVELVRDTKFIARPRGKRPRVTNAEELHLPEARLPVDPYVLGAWLGDGTSEHATMTAGDADMAWTRAEIEASGVVTTDRSTRCTFGMVGGVHEALGMLGVLGDKHIPAEYMRASAGQRLALLQGLVDTDGHVAPDGQVEFCSTDRRLAEQVQELVRSLGRKASLIDGDATIGGRFVSRKYRVMFYMAGAARMPRKAARCRDAARTYHRYISAEPAGRADTVCIEVDSPTHMFLCGRSMIPTHNSELASRKFPAWFLGRDPTRQVILATYNETFAKNFGLNVRELMRSPQFQQVFPLCKLRAGSQSSEYMTTQDGGEMSFVGLGGALTGRGADLMTIDDPIKNREEANSKGTRDKMWDWFTQVAMTRLMPGGRVVIIMTRWHEDDIVGRLIDPSNPCYNKEEAANWKVLHLPALAIDDDPMGRKPGEALWPERFPVEVLEAQRRLDAAGFSALYQGRPTPDDGDYFKAEWMQEYSREDLAAVMDRGLRIYGASDHAVSTAQDADKTCLGCVGVDEDDNIWVLPDLFWRRARTDLVCESMLDNIKRNNPIWWRAERGHISKAIGPFLRKRMQERQIYCPIEEVVPVKDKQSRAQAIRARMAMGKVKFPRYMGWWPDAKAEMLKFPQGRHDDFVDWLAHVGMGLATQVAAEPAIAKDDGPKTGTFGWLKKAAAAREAKENRLKSYWT